jgi:hypothetical protein
MIIIDKRLIILVCLVAALTFALGCKDNKGGVVPVTQATGCSALGTSDAIDQCYLGRVTTEGITDITFCDKIVGSGSKEDCYYQIFNKTKDTVNCTTMTNLEVRDTCDMVLGIEKMYFPYCDKIINLDKRDNCLYGITSRKIFSSDVQADTCCRIYNEERRKECFELIKS